MVLFTTQEPREHVFGESWPKDSFDFYHSVQLYIHLILKPGHLKFTKMSKKLEEELKERLHLKKLSRRGADLSSCNASGFCYEIDNENTIFVKVNSSIHARTMFEGEFESLKQMNATRTIKVPKPIHVMHNYVDSGKSAIVMDFLDIKHLSATCASELGESLANLHNYNNKVIKYNEKASTWIGHKQPSSRRLLERRGEEEEEETKDDNEDIVDETESMGGAFQKHGMRFKGEMGTEARRSANNTDEYPSKFIPEPGTQQVDSFGFDIPTSCGQIPQPNEWTDEWVPFFARHRLDSYIRMILSDHSDRDLNEQWSNLQLKVDKFFTDFSNKGEDKIVPALLHGDLWSGNAAEFADGSGAVVYDPASFYGHSEYDFGIARMFGGFPGEFERSYFEVLPKKKMFEKRNKLYQLFHHLNHWAHFGKGYRASSLRLIKDLNASV